jgi:flagellar export protein FliJ
VEAARVALVQARAEAEAVESLLEARRAEARRERLLAEQAVLDDVRR